MTNTGLLFVSLLFVLSVCGRADCEPINSAPATVVASGSPFWVDSELRPEFAMINARVDIGSMHQRADAIEAEVVRRLVLGMLRDYRAWHPGVVIPDGSTSVETTRIICRENHALYYTIEEKIVSPDGKTLDRQVYNAQEQRTKAEGRERESGLPNSYGSDAYSLVCWAAARKCEGKDYRWPPPPNLTPLEHSERATKMNAEYNQPFIPHCQLSAVKSSN
jgi:hypothetical protein